MQEPPRRARAKRKRNPARGWADEDFLVGTQHEEPGSDEALSAPSIISLLLQIEQGLVVTQVRLANSASGEPLADRGEEQGFRRLTRWRDGRKDGWMDGVGWTISLAHEQ